MAARLHTVVLAGRSRDELAQLALKRYVEWLLVVRLADLALQLADGVEEWHQPLCLARQSQEQLVQHRRWHLLLADGRRRGRSAIFQFQLQLEQAHAVFQGFEARHQLVRLRPGGKIADGNGEAVGRDPARGFPAAPITPPIAG